MFRHFFSSLVLLAVGTGAAFLTHLILAKFLGAEQYGVYSFIFSLSLLIGVFSLFGFQNSSVKIISISGDAAHPNARQFGLFSSVFTLSLALLSASIIYGVMYLTPLGDKYPPEVFMIGFLLTPLMVLMRLHAAFLRGFSRASTSIFYETTLREILFLFLILLVISLGTKFDQGMQALKLLLAALAIATAVSWFHAQAYFKKQIKPDKRLDGSMIREWTKLSFPMMLVIILQRLLRRSDIIILGLMVNPVLVGAYAIAAQFAEVSGIGQKSVFSIFSPLAAQYHNQGNKEHLKKLYTKMQLISIGLTGASTVVILVLAPPLLGYFGEEFKMSYEPLVILMAGQFINMCFGPVAILMLMAGRQEKAMHLTLITAIGNIVLNPLAIYYYGIEGAAYVTSFFLIMRGALGYYDIKKEALI